MVTDQSQAVVWQTEQTPFGEVTQTTGTLAQPLRFPGQYADPETGYSYNYFRDYDSSVGRYVQSDPIGLAGGVNTFGYAYQNPIAGGDPYGLWVNVAIGGTIRLIGGRAAGAALANAGRAAFGPVGGTVLACVLTGYCSESGEQGGDDVGESPRSCPTGNSFPDRPLPRDDNGRPIAESDHPHTQLGRRNGRNGSYPQGREFDGNGNPVRDIDFTDHGRPQNHANPHQHPYVPNPTGGTPQHGSAEPLVWP